MTVKEFVKKYNADKNIINEIVKTNYVSFMEKVSICKRIVAVTYMDENGNLRIDSPATYILYNMNLIGLYTNIDIDFQGGTITEDFDELNRNGILKKIISMIPENEVAEFSTVFDMVSNDLMKNQYDVHNFVKNQIDRISALVLEIVQNIDFSGVDFSNLIKGGEAHDE